MPPTTQTDDRPLLWYLRHDGLIRGPFTSATLRRLMLDDHSMRSAEVSQDKLTWRRALEVPEVIPPALREGAAPLQTQGQRPARPSLLLGLAVILVLVLAAGLAAWFMPKGQKTFGETPNCSAPPGPEVNWNNCRLLGVQASNAELQGLKASNADLRQAKFGGANLSQANLAYANLGSADLAYANLKGANLKGANLKDADLSYANLSGADLSFANLSGARLGNARMEGTLLDLPAGPPEKDGQAQPK